MTAHAVLFCLALGLVSAAKVEFPAASVGSAAGVMAKRSMDDLFKIPEWLQDIPQESKLAKYRKRRQIGFPSGSTLNVSVWLKMVHQDI